MEKTLKNTIRKEKRMFKSGARKAMLLTTLAIAGIGLMSGKAQGDIISYSSFSELLPEPYNAQAANNYSNPVLTEGGTPTTKSGIHIGFFTPYGGGAAVSGFLYQPSPGGYPEYLTGSFDYDFIGAGNTPAFSLAVQDTNNNGVIMRYNTSTGALYIDEGDTAWDDDHIQYGGVIGVENSSIQMPGTRGGTLNIPPINLTPEPGTLGLLGLAGTVLLSRKRKRGRPSKTIN